MSEETSSTEIAGESEQENPTQLEATTAPHPSLETTTNEAENIPPSQPIETIPSEEIKTEPTSQITIERTPDTVTITEVMPVPTPEVSKSNLDIRSFLKSLLPKLKEKLASRTEKRLAKILELARVKATKGEGIQNDDVEKLLRVSHRTASRYLKKLEARGLLRNNGNPKWEQYSPN